MSLCDLPALGSFVVQPGWGGRTGVHRDWLQTVGRKHRELPPHSWQKMSGEPEDNLVSNLEDKVGQESDMKSIAGCIAL